MTTTESPPILPGPFWPQRLPWRRSIAKPRSSPARKPSNCLTFTLASSNRRSPGPRTIPWTAGPDPSTTTSDRESLVGGHPRRVRLSHCDRLRQQ